MASVFLFRLKAALFYWLWLPFVVLTSGNGIDFLLHLKPLPHNMLIFVFAAGLLGFGVFWICWADYDLRCLGGGTPSPARPAKQLVTSGSYALCRHPMHFGYDLAALGVIFFMGSYGTLCVSYPLFLFWQSMFLHKEERLLASRFRQSYSNYSASTPFLIPRFFRRSIS